MNVWIIILITVMIASLIGVLYLMGTVAKFPIIEKISGGKKWLKALISLAILGVLFALLTFTLSMTNAIVIFLGAFAIRLVTGIIFAILKAVRKKPFKVYWQGYVALAATVLYFVVGYFLCANVWAKEYKLTTEKDLGSLRIAMFADSHLGTTFNAEGFGKWMDEIMEYNPDILLIVGDFVDDGTSDEDMTKACEKLGTLNPKYGVWFTYGNHDRGYYRGKDGFVEDDLINELVENKVRILKDESALIDDRFYLVGREDAYNTGREQINKLVSELDEDKYIIVLDHQPNDYANEANAKVDLVLSGHTHGGQLFPINHVGDWFNINDRTYGYEKRDNTDFIVTSGISCWEIKFKTGTKSEFLIIDIN